MVITTGTGSGKVFCHNILVFEAIARDPGTIVLYLFSTKVPSRDQLKAIWELEITNGLLYQYFSCGEVI